MNRKAQRSGSRTCQGVAWWVSWCKQAQAHIEQGTLRTRAHVKRDRQTGTKAQAYAGAQAAHVKRDRHTARAGPARYP